MDLDEKCQRVIADAIATGFANNRDIGAGDMQLAIFKYSLRQVNDWRRSAGLSLVEDHIG
jgi:ApbE superfamily uncharacterized protein (UPF0280 family)